MKNKLLDLLTREQLVSELKLLGSASKIAKKYGINYATACSAFKKIGIEYRKNADAENILTKDQLEKDYAELQSFRKIGKKYGISNETIRYYMQKFNLQYNELKIYNVDHDYFSRENAEVFYIAGFLAADGCVKRRKNSTGNSGSYELSLALSKKDKDFVELIRTKLQAETPVRDFLVKNSKRNSNWNDVWKSELIITSKKIYDDLTKFNIVPRKSNIYTFPEWLVEHPLVHHYMRGYNDGDGCFHIPKLANGRTEIQIHFALRGTPEFLKVYRTILEQKCDLKIRDTDIRISSGHGILEYGGNGVVQKIVQFLYRDDIDMFLPRKKKIIKKLI